MGPSFSRPRGVWYNVAACLRSQLPDHEKPELNAGSSGFILLEPEPGQPSPALRFLFFAFVRVGRLIAVPGLELVQLPVAFFNVGAFARDLGPLDGKIDFG